MWNRHTSKAGVFLQVDSALSFVYVWWYAGVGVSAYGGVCVCTRGVHVVVWVHLWSARGGVGVVHVQKSG